MIDMIGRIIALWKPPQRVVDGKLLDEQIEVKEILIKRNDDGSIFVGIETYEPILQAPIRTSALITPKDIAEKKAGLGQHVLAHLTQAYRHSVASHPRGHEASGTPPQQCDCATCCSIRG